jgi:putative drug exporter of the RND superfamily
VLVPALMQLMGRWNWWLPRPLARALPRLELP